MKKILLFALIATMLFGCSDKSAETADYLEQDHTISDYRMYDELRTATLKACTSDNDAEQRRLAKEFACIKARKADDLILEPFSYPAKAPAIENE